MKICPKCEEEHSTNIKFCSRDGTELITLSCPRCKSTLVSVTDKFCENCGQDVTPHVKAMVYTIRKSNVRLSEERF